MFRNNLRRNFSSHFKITNNIPDGIWDLTQRKIYKIPNHPIRILIDKIEDFFKNDQHLYS